MLSQKPSGLSTRAGTQSPLFVEEPRTLDDLAVTVTSLPGAGIILKSDGLTQVAVGDTLTAAEIAALSCAPTSRRSGEASPGNGLAIYVPQGCGRLPIPLLADLAADTAVEITELPGNGVVLLADGMTAIARGQVIIAAQLCGLTFRPLANAIGQISVLRYRSTDGNLTGEVLLVVGPDAASDNGRDADSAAGTSSIAPLAAALLLETGLSSLKPTAASAAVNAGDHSPRDSFTSPGTAGSAGWPAGFVPHDFLPDHIIAPAPEIPAQSATTGTDTTGSTGTNPSPSDRPPHHRIGSSSPQDFGSVKLAPLSLTLTAPNPPTIPSIPSTPASESLPSSLATLPNDGLLIGPAGTAVPGTTHWANSGGGSWNVAANWSDGVPGLTSDVFIDASGSYVVTSTANVDINSLTVGAGATVLANPGTLFTVEGGVVDNGIIEAGPFGGGQGSTVDIKGDVSGSGVLDIANQAVLEIQGSVSGQTAVAFGSANGELILDHSSQFQGVIAGSSSGAPLAPTDMIDLKDLAFTSSMSTSINYDMNSNISTVSFGNGTNTVTLQFSGKDPVWNLSSDGHGGTIISDPPATNPIVLENELPGTPMSVWQIDPGEDSTLLQGFTTEISTDVGGTVQFKIDNLTGNPDYQIQIYRLGYYGGDGARLMTTLQHTTSVVQPNPITNAATGEVDAGNWSVTDSWTMPSTAVSGVYVANVVQGDQVFQIPFIVKDPTSTSDIVFQTDDETWQAYNGWGGANLYGGDGPSNPPPDIDGEAVPGAAFAVSYNRPIVSRDSIGQFAGPQDSLFGAEYAAIYWMEENGYDVSYISGMDTATDGALLLNHKVFMDAGHDEYWTDSQVANVQAAENAGVNLVFMSGNEMFWQTQFQPSIDGSNTPDRTLVSYKDSHFEQLINPDGQGTGAFEAPVSWGGLNLPSNAITGQLFSVDQAPTLGTITIPSEYTQLRFWRNTSIADTPAGQTASLESNLLGYEWDSSPDNGFMPAGLIDLSSTTLVEPTVNAQFGNVDETGSATHNLVEYRDPTSGALVFGAGTVFWSWGLSSEHDPGPNGNQTNTDPNIQQAMVNLLADMGVQPETLQASLVIATASTDHTPPTSTITSISTTDPVEGQTVTVSGTATDVGGLVGAVQISTDGGQTWHVTSGQIGTQTVTWTYTFSAPAPGTYTIETRAVDDSLNLETPGPGTTYTATPSPDLSIFPSSAPSDVSVAHDGSSVEIGVKFTSTTSGEITGIRFYKDATDTGTHIGDLWSSSGTLLASAVFTDETASGWQQVTFATPVNITAGTTYIASYNSSSGSYDYTDNYFDTYFGQTNGSLTAPGEATNGVYAYASGSVFPANLSTDADNYWVDVVYNDTSRDPQTPNVGGFTVAENGTLTIAASALLANVTDPGGLPIVFSGVGNAVNGSVSYDPGTQNITFTPNTGYAGAAQFTYTVSDTSGASGSGQVSLDVTYPVTAQSLFGSNDTPSVANSNDPTAAELGVEFTASANGVITGIRFYKGTGNTGTHIADLWSANGTLLATATFTSETASGWQEVNFSTPVSVTAGTTYIASYHTNGDYSDTPGYFTSPVTNGELTAPVNAGVYAYGTGSTFPTSTFNATNYWVDVVFDGNPTATPVANPDGGFVASENTPLSIAASKLLANDTDSGGLAISITAVGNAVNGSVSYDTNSQTVTFTPTTGYTGPASFSYTITDTDGGTASASVSLVVNNPSAEDLFSSSATPSVVTVNDPSAVELGVKFTADADGVITGIRFYKGPDNTGPHVADLWSSNGTLLATATFSNETASGWQEVDFSTPVTITAGTTYIASYHTNGDYSANGNFFATPLVSGDLTATNGVYTYSSGSAFPTDSFNNTNYWVDVVYTKTQPPPVANDDSGLVATENNPITIAASTLLANDTDPNGQALSVTGVGNATNGTVSYDANNQTVTFTPNANYTGTASFTYSIADTGGATASATASLLVNDPSTVSLFNPATAPSMVNVSDPSSVELGLKFQATENGEITGIRFYKGPGEGGTQVADLWSSTGTLLASANFTNETPSGWQQVNFATPVAITADTTYVASYFTTGGEYSVDPNLFATTLTNGPLTAPSSASSGGNGVYAYGSSSLFPTNSFNSTSYGVDVVFKPQLAG